MGTIGNKYITVVYKLYTVEDGEKELFEEMNAEHPFQLTSGLGTTLESSKNQIVASSRGDKPDLTVPVDEAYGVYDKQYVFDLPKSIFKIDGKLDNERIAEGSIILSMTGDGKYVSASVVEVKPDIVIADPNHPLAGVDLIFEDEVIGSRPATNKEIQELVKMVSDEGCGCGYDSYGGGCSDGCGREDGHYH